jgi:hypothetical protein
VTSLTQVRQWSPDRLDEAVGQTRVALEDLRTLEERLLWALPGTWEGSAAAQAGARHTELLEQTRRLAEGLSRVLRALAAARAELEAVRRVIAQAQREAQAQGLHITDAGEVRPVARLDPVPMPSMAVSAIVQDLVRCALDRSASLDEALAAALHEATLGHERVSASRPAPGPWGRDGDSAVVGPWLGTLDPAPPGLDGTAATPQANATWFATFEADDLDRLVREHPEWVGPRDGLPAWARDRANRILLDQDEHQLQAQLSGLRARQEDWSRAAPATFGTFPGHGELAGVRAKLEALATVRALLARNDGATRQLLSIDVSGRLATAAVTTGNLDTAGHVAVFVPGFTTTVNGSLDLYDSQMSRIAEQATRLAAAGGDGRPVVGVSWLGYQAPQMDELAVPGGSVLTSAAAAAGAPRLADAVSGLDAAARQRAQRPGPHGIPVPPEASPSILVVGHSYGTLVAGLALRDHVLPVDAVAVLGSPGMGVSSLAKLHLGPGVLYAGDSGGDLVARSGRFGSPPTSFDGVQVMSTKAATLPDGSTGTASSGHSHYLDPGTTSAWNLAAVAAGRTDLVLTQPWCDTIVVLGPRPAGCPGARHPG